MYWEMNGLKISVSGIRGRTFGELKPELVLNTALALGFMARGKKILIARDTRASGRSISRIVVGALQSTGVKVIDCGILPTPSAAFLTLKLGCRFGIVITASHNPLGYNGIKIFNSEGNYIDSKTLQSIIADKAKEAARTGTVGWVNKQYMRSCEVDSCVSSKSSAWPLVPLINAASEGAVFLSKPIIDESPGQFLSIVYL